MRIELVFFCNFLGETAIQLVIFSSDGQASPNEEPCAQGRGPLPEAIPGPILTVKEAAHILGVSTRTVYGWIKDGRIPAVRLGPKLLRVPTERLMETATEDGSR